MYADNYVGYYLARGSDDGYSQLPEAHVDCIVGDCGERIAEEGGEEFEVEDRIVYVKVNLKLRDSE